MRLVRGRKFIRPGAATNYALWLVNLFRCVIVDMCGNKFSIIPHVEG